MKNTKRKFTAKFMVSIVLGWKRSYDQQCVYSKVVEKREIRIGISKSGHWWCRPLSWNGQTHQFLQPRKTASDAQLQNAKRIIFAQKMFNENTP
jgi:hypothetical protein